MKRLINYDEMRTTVARGLKQYLGCEVIRQNQTKTPPAYPYLSYTITTLESENKGTYGEYEDGIDRKPITQTWSISVHSASDTESVLLASKAREWLDRVGTTYLKDNNVDVQSVGSITNRDNLLTIGYEYKKGFDVVFWLFDEVENPTAKDGNIELFEPNVETSGGE